MPRSTAAKSRRHPPAVSTPGVNAAESPLAWLRRRKSADGRPLIGDGAFAAGERFRGDYTRAGLMPRMTVDWDMPIRGGGSGIADLHDAAIDARARVNAAISALGPDLAHLLIDVCCHLKGLTVVEAERGWPRRSGKVVLDLALTHLARHYGYGEAEGPSASRHRHWGEDGYRPEITPD